MQRPLAAVWVGLRCVPVRPGLCHVKQTAPLCHTGDTPVGSQALFFDRTLKHVRTRWNMLWRVIQTEMSCTHTRLDCGYRLWWYRLTEAEALWDAGEALRPGVVAPQLRPRHRADYHFCVAQGRG